MTATNLATLSEAELIDRFRGYALQRVLAKLDSNRAKITRLYHQLEAVEAELVRRGPEARRALLTLLDDSNLRVRYEAAVRCLALDRVQAVAVLEGIVKSHKMPEAGEAGMTLDALEKGIFKPR